MNALLLTIVSVDSKPGMAVLDCFLSRSAKSGKITGSTKIMESDMKRILVAVIAFGAMFSNAAFASEQLAKEKNCLACHAVDNKLVGPGYKEVAAKYKGDKSAEDKLAQKIMKGGSGVWGQIPMPANPQVSAAEAKTLAKWVLSLK
jgi:cytochrome c